MRPLKRPQAYHPSPANWRFPFYTVTLDRFVNGNPNNDDINGTAWEHDLTGCQLRFGGDVTGLQESLDYVAGMGIKGIFISGSPLINGPWDADGYSPLDLTLLDPHLGTIEQWRDLVDAVHSRGMYLIVDNLMATMGDLIGFEGYLNVTTPLSYTEHNAIWKSSRRYHDFDFGNDELRECDYPRFWGSDGEFVIGNGTENFRGCRDSEFDQYGDVATFGLYPEWQRQLSKFASVQDRLREWRPSVREKIQHLNCLQITMLDIDGFRMDKGLQITADAQGDWTYHIRRCAASVGKRNFFIPGEIVGGNPIGAVYIRERAIDGRGVGFRVGHDDRQLVEFVIVYQRPGQDRLRRDSLSLHDLPQSQALLGVEAFNNILVTNDLVNADTGLFDPRHMFGSENQDVFRWPSIVNGTLKGNLGAFITTLVLPGIPLLIWGQEQALYVLDNSASNYVYGRQPIASNTAWQDHGCYKLGNSRQANWPDGPYADGCGDDWNSLDHRDPSHPVRNILATMFEMRTRYPVLNDGFLLQTLSKSTYDIYLPASRNQRTETGLWSVMRSRWTELQDLSGQGQGNQTVWLVYHNEGINKTYTFNCSDNSTALLSPFPKGTKVKGLLYPFQEHTLEASSQKLVIEGSEEYNGCLASFALSPWGYQAFVPYEKWLNPSPVITNFWFRVGRADNPIVFPRTANYSSSLLHQMSNSSLYVMHKAAGADKFRYSLNWASSWSEWFPYQGGNHTLDRQPWSGTTSQNWTGEHVMVQYWSRMLGSSDYIQQGDLSPTAKPRRYPHMFVHGAYNSFGYDNGLRHVMQQDSQGIWKFDFMTEWPSVFQLNVWGINPDGTPDLTRVFGDPDMDGVLDRLSPVSLLKNVVNVTDYPPPPFVAYQIAANDGSRRYTLTPTGLRHDQMIIYFLLMFLPVMTSLGGIWLYRHVFYVVKVNEIGKPEGRNMLPTYIRSSTQLKRYLAKSNLNLFRKSRVRKMLTTETADYDSIGVFEAPSGKRSRTVLIATMEYDIEDWGIKIKIGGLGVMAQLMGKHLNHQELIWVVPCVGGVDFPIDYRAEPMRITILGQERVVQVQYHKLRNITYVLLDAPIFRSQTKSEPYPARMDDIESAIYYSAWNSCIAETMKRFPIDLYHINDYHGAIAQLHLLPQTIPCCLSLHNAEFQGLWPIRTPDEMKEISSVYNLSQEVVSQYIQFGEVFNLLHGGVSYLRVWQRGYGAAGVSAKYGKRSFARYPIFWGLSKIDSLPNPDPTDTADWDNQLPKMNDMKVDEKAEAARAGFKRQAQEWAGLEQKDDAELFVFVGRWSMQKGIDLIADVFPAVLKEHPTTQLICVGPVIDLYGRFAALKLNKLMELHPGRVYSKPEFTALPPFIFSGAEFALIPSRDEPFGLVAVEFGRKGALGVGARVGGLGNMPGWWFTVESTTTKHLLRQFQSAIRVALASKPNVRAKMRARSAIQRFPVAHWKEQLATMHEIAIKVNQKSAIKHGLELRGEYNTSLASSVLPSSNVSIVSSPPQSACMTHETIDEDDEPIDTSQSTLSTPDHSTPGGLPQRLSLGVRVGPGSSSPKISLRGVDGKIQHDPFWVRKSYLSNKSNDIPEKDESSLSHDPVDGTASSAIPGLPKKQEQSRDSVANVAKSFASFRFRNTLTIDTSKARLAGHSIMNEKADQGVQSQCQSGDDEVLLTPEQATASDRMSMMACGQATNSFRKSSSALPYYEQMLRKGSFQQQSTDAYLALIGRTRQDVGGDQNQSSSSKGTSPQSSKPQTPFTPNLPPSTTVRDFAETASPKKGHLTETFETRRGTVTFGSPGVVKSYEHPVVDNPRFSYGTVLQGKKDYALQNVEPFFTDPTGLYYKAFHLELKDLDSKNSEDGLCIEKFLTMSEKDWYDRLHKVKMGKRASRAPAATIFHAPAGRTGSVVSIFNENVENAAVPDNSAEQFLLREQYEPPKGLKKLLLRRPREWPFYSYLLAFGQIIAANSYQVTLISGQVGQSANKLYTIAAIYLATSVAWWILFRRLKSIYVLSLPFGLYGLAFFLLGIAPYADGDATPWIQDVATGVYATASSSGAFYFSLNFGSEGSVPVATWSFRACAIQGTQQIYVTVLWLWGNHLTKLNAQGVAAFTWQTYRPILTGISIPVAVLMWVVGVVLFLGLPDYYRQKPGQVPSFYASIGRRKVIIWFFIAVILQNYFLSAPFGRNWRYLWSSQHAPAWAVVLLVILFFVAVWALILWLLAILSVHHSWIIPICAIGLGCPRWCQMLWSTSGMGTWVPWAGGPVAQALTGRVLWLWLGVLDAVQGVGFGMILLQTLTRFHVTFTLVAAQVLGSVATILARATAPNRDGPGTVFPNLVLEGGEG
ncbi:MAG: hypothetical protein Q9196_004310, partial [Gyalolechia fulgens]